ncbi:MAG: VWA domain-containing protein [Bacilli bacterium]|nr:VWA domain-containing protein [Bacilli bacterium]
MSFLFPLGLLGLIGIPVIIIIYIIKNRYTEQTVSSTYIWTLSERFLKNKRPISKLKGLISLLLQLAAVFFISIAVAHPVFKVKNAAKEYCFVLDCTASMAIDTGNGTRFEVGKQQIADMINGAADGSTFTLIQIGVTTRTIYERFPNKEKAIEILEGVEQSDITSNTLSAWALAKDYFDQNSSTEVYLVTDTAYETENVTLVNVATEVDNFAITTANYATIGEKLRFQGKAISYQNDAELEFNLYLDDVEITDYELQVETLGILVTKDNLALTAGVEKDFFLELPQKDFVTAKIEIKNQDSLDKDNVYMLYNVSQEHNYSAIVISETPFFIKSVIATVSDASVYCIKPEEYDESVHGHGYDLYVFDGYSPSTLPRDGSIWFFDIRENIPNSGFTIQDEIELGEASQITYRISNSSEYRKFTQGTVGSNIFIGRYVKYGIYANGFTTILTYEGDPVVFTGLNGYGNRQVTFAFNLHDSDMPMQADWLILAKNFISYSFPEVIETSNYVCGDELNINVLSSCKSIKVEAPSGEVTYLDTNEAFASTPLTEVGEYKISVLLGDQMKEFRVFSSLPPQEGQVIPNVYESFLLEGEKTENYIDGKFDKLWIIIAIIGVIFVADWIIYCYEQYQLQ